MCVAEKKITFGDQSISVIDRFLPYRSSQNSQTRLTRLPSDSSLCRALYRSREQMVGKLTLQLPLQWCNPECNHIHR